MTGLTSSQKKYYDYLFAYYGLTGSHLMHSVIYNHNAKEEIRLHNWPVREGNIVKQILTYPIRFYVDRVIVGQKRQIPTGGESPTVRQTATPAGITMITTDRLKEVNIAVGSFTQITEFTQLANLVMRHTKQGFDGKCSLELYRSGIESAMFSHSLSLTLEILRPLLALAGSNVLIGSDFSGPFNPTWTRFFDILFPALSLGMLGGMLEALDEMRATPLTSPTQSPTR